MRWQRQVDRVVFFCTKNATFLTLHRPKSLLRRCQLIAFQFRVQICSDTLFSVFFCYHLFGPFGPHRPPWPRTDDSPPASRLARRLDPGGLLRGAPHRRIAVPLPTHGLARLRGPSTDRPTTDGPKGRGMGEGSRRTDGDELKWPDGETGPE